MSARRKPTLAAPTAEERAKAFSAAVALREAIADPSTMGDCATLHVLLARPRRGEWWSTWRNLPGFTSINRRRFTHELLPGWEYARHEIVAEMIPDLEALAERGERPTGVTR